MSDDQMEQDRIETEALLEDSGDAEVIREAALAALADPELETAEDDTTSLPAADEELEEIPSTADRVPRANKRRRPQRPTIAKRLRGFRGERWRRGGEKVYQGGLVLVDGEEHVVAGVRSNGVINIQSGQLYYRDEYTVVQARPDQVDAGQGGQ